MPEPVVAPAAVTTTTGAAVVAAVVDAAAAATPPVPKPAELPPRDGMAERFAQLAKQSKALALDKQKLSADRQAHESALKAREDALAARAAKAEALEKRFASMREDPEPFLAEALGDNYYDLLTQRKLEGRMPADHAVRVVREEAKAEVEKLRKENEARWTAAEEERKKTVEAAKTQATEEQRAVIDDFRRETVDFVTANPEKYELINLNEAQHLVVQVIEQTFAKSQRIMSREEAADAVEKHLEEQVAKNIASKKWAARQAATPKPAAEPSSEPARGITNAAGSGVGTPPASSGSPDRYARAIAAMEAVEKARAGS